MRFNLKGGEKRDISENLGQTTKSPFSMGESCMSSIKGEFIPKGELKGRRERERGKGEGALYKNETPPRPNWL